MNLQLQAYRPAYRDACITIFRSNVPRYFRDHELAKFLEFIDSSDCPYFVVKSNAEILGCGGFGFRAECDIADLCWGMVHATHHRNGLGKFLLLARLNRIVDETDAKGVRLGTSQLTDEFFQRLGFKIQSKISDGIADGLDDVEMHLQLTDDIRDSIRHQWRDIIGSPGTAF